MECYCVSSKMSIMCEKTKLQTVTVISLWFHVASDWLLHNGKCQSKCLHSKCCCTTNVTIFLSSCNTVLFGEKMGPKEIVDNALQHACELQQTLTCLLLQFAMINGLQHVMYFMVLATQYF